MDDGRNGVFKAQLIWRVVMVLGALLVMVIMLAQWTNIDSNARTVNDQIYAMEHLIVAGIAWLTIVLATTQVFEN